MKKTIITTLGVILLTLSMTNCSYDTVPQGSKGKVLDRSGFHPEVYPPSRVETGMHGKLVLVETVTHTVNETITIRMADDMNLVAQVRFKLRMGEKPQSLNLVFNDIKPAAGNLITLKQVYDVHGKMLVNKVAREILGQYTIGDVNNNFTKISGAIYNATLEAFKPTPLIVTDVALGKLDYPEVIDKAIEAAAKRELEIKQAEADVQVRLTELQGKEQVAKGEYRIAMQKAKRVRDYNKMIAEGVTPQLIELQRIEVQEKMVDAVMANNNAIYIPTDMFNNTAPVMKLK